MNLRRRERWQKFTRGAVAIGEVTVDIAESAIPDELIPSAKKKTTKNVRISFSKVNCEERRGLITSCACSSYHSCSTRNCRWCPRWEGA